MKKVLFTLALLQSLTLIGCSRSPLANQVTAPNTVNPSIAQGTTLPTDYSGGTGYGATSPAYGAAPTGYGATTPGYGAADPYGAAAGYGAAPYGATTGYGAPTGFATAGCTGAMGATMPGAYGAAPTTGYGAADPYAMNAGAGYGAANPYGAAAPTGYGAADPYAMNAGYGAAAPGMMTQQAVCVTQQGQAFSQEIVNKISQAGGFGGLSADDKVREALKANPQATTLLSQSPVEHRVTMVKTLLDGWAFDADKTAARQVWNTIPAQEQQRLRAQDAELAKLLKKIS
jgi:hypothetical protein